VLAVGNCCYVAVCLAAEGTSAPKGGGEGRVITWRPPAYSLLTTQLCSKLKTTKLTVTKLGVGLISEPTGLWHKIF